MIFAYNNLVAGNRITGGGIHVFGRHNQILRNRISRGGIVVDNYVGNVLDGNVIDRAPELGILVTWLNRDFEPTTNTVVRNNVVTRSADVGIEIDGARGTRVTGNRVSPSGGD